MKPRYDSKNLSPRSRSGPSRGEGTCGTGVHDRSETVHRGSLATSATCGGRSRGRLGAGPSLRCARLLGRARVPQVGDLVQRIGPRPFAERAFPREVLTFRRTPTPTGSLTIVDQYAALATSDAGHRLSQEAGPAQARRGGDLRSPRSPRPRCRPPSPALRRLCSS